MSDNSSNTFMLGGKMSIPHWPILCDLNIIKERPPLHSMTRVNATSADVYPKFMDALPKVFSTSSIPEALRGVPIDERDRRWLYLNPHTAVVKIRPGFPIDKFILRVSHK